MEKKFTIGVIGAGFMGSAVINRLVTSNVLPANKIIVADKFEQSLNNISKLGVNVTTDNCYLAKNSDFVLFAIKPQQSKDVFLEISNCGVKKIISIMAGVKISTIKEYFSNAKVARFMPNTPCSLGSGAVGADISDFTNETEVAFIKAILGVLGYSVLVNEEDISNVIGVAGSAPAYFYLFIKAIVDAGVKRGLTEEDAKKLATHTMIGSGEMILSSDKSLDDLVTAVCSKGGTTIEAVKVFNNGLGDLVEDAINACVNRSKELEKGL